MRPPRHDGLTLEDIWGFDEVRAGAPDVLCGSDRLATAVRWVHVADGLEGAGVVEGGELVLTTGQVFRGSEERTRGFLDDAEARGAAGVLIELIGADGTPDRGSIRVLREVAAGRGLPVILVQHRIRFAHVTQEAHRILLNEQLTRLHRAQRVHDVFTRLSLEGADEQRIVDQAGELLSVPVVLEDLRGRVLAYHAAGLPAAALLEGWGERSRHEDYLQETGRDPGGSGWLQTPVGVSGRRWGRLVLPGGALDPDAGQILERAGQALTLRLMAVRDQRDLLQQARAGLVHDLRRPGGIDEGEAAARIETMGVSAGVEYLPIAVRLDALPDESPTGLQHRGRVVREALAEMEFAAGGLSIQLRPDVIAAIVPVSRGGEAATMSAVCAALGDLRSGAPTWTVGLARPRSGLREAAGALDEAGYVADVAATFDARDRPFYRIEDARLRGLVTLLADDDRLEAFAVSELGPLLAEEHRELLDFLAAYLRHAGNKSAVASALHLSRPAVYARMERIERILGLSLEDAESLASLHVALLWHELRRRVGGRG